jgi:hypothetical protein
MKKLLLLCGLFLLWVSGYSQLSVNQSIVQQPPYKVGDTISVNYTLSRGTTNPKPRYFWLRYQYNNKALEYVSTTWSQGSQTQVYYTNWSNYVFNANAGVAATDLYGQYMLTPWAYVTNVDWSVGQLSIQRVDKSMDGLFATQKYIIKDKSGYDNIHKLDLSYALDSTAGANISPLTTTGGSVGLTQVVGNTSQFKVRVLYPTNYTNIADHSVQLMPLKTDGSGDIDWTKQPIATKALDATGEATFISGIKVGDSLGIFIAPAMQKSFMNNIVTVSDAYKAFLGVSQTDINGNANYFTYPNLEKHVGNVTLGDTTFNENDAYFLFSYVMGINVSSNTGIPTSSAQSIKWQSGLLNQSWLDGKPKYRTYITSSNQAVDAVYAWGGDMDWSHSTSPSQIASKIASGNYNNSVNPGSSDIKIGTMSSLGYQAAALETVNLNVTSTLQNGKVVLTTTLSKEGLAGLQVIMNYDTNKLSLDNVIFDAGSTITNFSTHDNGRLTFGSIDQLKVARIKTGTPYKLIFTPKVPLTNTSGLFFFVLADAVDAGGNKVNLVVE